MPKIKAKCTAKETLRTIENPTRRLLGVTVFSKHRHLQTVWPQPSQIGIYVIDKILKTFFAYIIVIAITSNLHVAQTATISN